MASLGGVPKVLFIGNSLTYFNNGLWTHVKVSFCVAVHNVSSIVRKHPNSAALLILWHQGLCDAAQPPIPITTDKAVEPGATLSVLWGRPQPRKRMGNAPSVVILQGADMIRARFRTQ